MDPFNLRSEGGMPVLLILSKEHFIRANMLQSLFMGASLCAPVGLYLLTLIYVAPTASVPREIPSRLREIYPEIHIGVIK